MEEMKKIKIKTDVVYLFETIIIARCACDINRRRTEHFGY